VSYSTLSNILVALSAAALLARALADAFLAAEGRRSCLRSATPRFAAKRYLLLKHCAPLVSALQLRSAAELHHAHAFTAAPQRERSATAE